METATHFRKPWQTTGDLEDEAATLNAGAVSKFTREIAQSSSADGQDLAEWSESG